MQNVATRSVEPKRKEKREKKERKKTCKYGIDPVTLKCIRKKKPTKDKKPCKYGIDPVTLKCLRKRKQKEEKSRSDDDDDLIPYDSRTGNPIPDEISIEDPSVKDYIQWRDLKGRIVDISGDVALGYGELKSEKKKEVNKVRLKFVPAPYGGILTAGEEEFKCFRKGEVPAQLGDLRAASPRQTNVVVLSIKRRPNLENTSDELKKELNLTTDKSIKMSKHAGVDYMYNETNSNERIPVQFSENIWRKIS